MTSLSKRLSFLFVIALAVQLLQSNALANAPKVGRRAAAKYFQANGKTPDNNFDEPSSQRRYEPRSPSNIEALSPQDRYLTFGVSNYMSSDAYKWGQDGKEEKVGKWGIDMTYRISDYNNLLDQAVRISYTEYEPTGRRASKMSFLYAMTLPDAGSRFPLYFGFAVGPGIFFKQLEDESPLALDYQLYAGLRLFNVFENTGFYVEGGLKNHLQLTSDGQLNGTYISAGAVFTF